MTTIILTILLIVFVVISGTLLMLYVLKCNKFKALQNEMTAKKNKYDEDYQNLKNLESDLLQKKEETEKTVKELEGEKENLLRDRESLNNAMRLFKQQKEAHESFAEKTEKDIAIDLYLKFIDLESTFTYFQNNLASVDAKLLGVKNYSDDLERMRKEVNESKDSVIKQMSTNSESVNEEMVKVKDTVIDSMNICKDETINELGRSRDSVRDVFEKAAVEIKDLKTGMTNLQTSYASELNSILLATREFLMNVQRDLQQIMTSTFDSESKKYFTEMYTFGGTIDKKITQFNDTIVNLVDGKLSGVCDEIKNNTVSNVTSSVTQYISRYDNSIASFNNHVASITEQMNAFNSSFDNKFKNLSQIIESSYDCDSFKETVSDAVEDAFDISGDVESALDSYRFKDNVKESVKDTLEEYFYYNYNFEEKIKNAVENSLGYDVENKIRSFLEDEISSRISHIESDINDIKYKLD